MRARGMRGMSASGAVYHPPLWRLVTKQPKRFAGVARPHTMAAINDIAALMSALLYELALPVPRVFYAKQSIPDSLRPWQAAH